jgi:GNAT superfamily N-acetyltransferase
MPGMAMTNTFHIRSAAVDDVALIRTLIRELAEYEKLEHEAVATEALLREHLFGPQPKAECLIAEAGDAPAGRGHGAVSEASVGAERGPSTGSRTHFADGENTVSPVGFALFFHNFSTFVGKPGIYLEDLFVRPAARGRGIGKALLVRLAQIAVERDCGRFEWSVLDWNEPALRFYESLGAVPKKEWIIHRVSGEALARLAAGGG